MNPTWVIFRKEVASFFNSLIAYVVLTVFLVGIGLFFWVFAGNVLESGLADMSALFVFAPWFFLLLIPAITMRAFAEEFRTGTFEWLSTQPVTDWQMVLGKYFAAVGLVVFALVPTLLYYFTLQYLGNPAWNLDSGAIWGSYLGLIGIGATFAAIGIFTSTLTDNQIVSFILAAFVSFLLFQGLEMLANLTALAEVNEFVSGLGLQAHYESISRGVVDSRDVVYFLSVIGFFLALSRLSLQARKR